MIVVTHCTTSKIGQLRLSLLHSCLLPGCRDVGAIISKSLISGSQGATVFKLRLLYFQDQFFNQVLQLGGRITDASQAASRGSCASCD
jgi:hypothetical protein